MENVGHHVPDSSALQHQGPEIFKEALENATDAIGMSTPQGRHYYQNKAFTDLFGNIGQYPPATLYRDQKVGKDVFRTIMGGGTWTGEVEMYAKDRRILSILLRAYAFTDQQGKIIGLVGIHTDITERRKTEEALRLSEATYREIFNSINDTIWIHDIDTFEFIDVNDKVTEMFGYSVAEAMDLNVDDISSGVPPFTKETAATLLRNAAAGEAQIFEWHTRHKDGHLFWTEVSLKRGTVAGRDCLLAIERDITARKQAEEALQRAHALESLANVAGGIAHDFNNLLMGVFGNMELAQTELPQNHPALTSIEAANQALENARHLTTQLLTFARGGNPVLETVDLHKCIRKTVKFHLTGSNVAACFDIPAVLWPAKADKGQLAEVIANLTLNAKEAMPAGGTLHVRAENVPEIQVPATFALRGDCVKLTFTDEGVGIPENIVGRIFDPYFTTKQAGSGLGLSIVHGIVTRHNGHIGVESSPGGGTTFTMFIPADTSVHPLPTTQESQMRVEPFQDSIHVLVMDDEEVIRQTASMMLGKLGCSVETAVDGNAAIDKCAAALERGRPFDLTILDLTIPGGMGGKEAIGKLLAIDPSAKVLVASGYSSDPVLSDHTKLGFAGRLAKPFTLRELHEAISRVLQIE